MNEIQGTHFHDRRIHSNINYHSEFKVSKMRIVGQVNRENLMAAVTACKALDVSDEAIQTCIEKFPGIPNRMEFIMEKNGVCFYNDSKAETMPEMLASLKSFKEVPKTSSLRICLSSSVTCKICLIKAVLPLESGNC